jgi:hypothetical protein
MRATRSNSQETCIQNCVRLVQKLIWINTLIQHDCDNIDELCKSI